MDSTIIKNINKTVGEDDELYILGDFCMNGGYEKRNKYREQINCKHVHLILGNHDTKLIENGKPSPFESELDYKELRYKDTNFCLSHYPYLSWHLRELDSIMCHGHVHSNKRSNKINQWQQIHRYDVGVDANDYAPVSIDYILNFFNESLKDIFD
jgi:calcineurin-like phosphoesterase family protein